MRTQRIRTLAIAVALFLVVSGVVAAFSMSNVDGVWGQIDEGTGSEGADGDRWATGYGDVPEPPGHVETDLWDQTTGYTNTDENQVRYGSNSSTFGNKSGFGFDGVDSVNGGAQLTAFVPFVLGRFTHYNNPIQSSNGLEFVDLDVTIDGIYCAPGVAPAEGTSLTFAYRFYLDETPNEAPCAYAGSSVCPDKVDVGGAPGSEFFTCVGTLYEVNILGFERVGSATACSSLTQMGTLESSFITEESQDNHACLWASIEEYNPNDVELVSFTAVGGETSIELAWETASEIDNVGFNLYRAESESGARVKLNGEIMPAKAMGSVMGATYSFTDGAVTKGVTYFYWLEDVDVAGVATLHGPVSARLAEAAAAPAPVLVRPVRELPVIGLPALEPPTVVLPVLQAPVVELPGLSMPVPAMPAPIVQPPFTGLPVELGME